MVLRWFLDHTTVTNIFPEHVAVAGTPQYKQFQPFFSQRELAGVFPL
jgi:hypothetical protein